jgi:hypothetical protein
LRVQIVSGVAIAALNTWCELLVGLICPARSAQGISASTTDVNSSPLILGIEHRQTEGYAVFGRDLLSAIAERATKDSAMGEFLEFLMMTFQGLDSGWVIFAPTHVLVLEPSTVLAQLQEMVQVIIRSTRVVRDGYILDGWVLEGLCQKVEEKYGVTLPRGLRRSFEEFSDELLGALGI